MRLPFIIVLTFIICNTFAQQKVSGSWFGTADVEMEGVHNNYLVELTIKQKGNEVEGTLGYYFRDGYQSYFIRGKFSEKNRILTIKNLPITYFRGKNVDGVDCYMDFEAILIASKVKSNLKGTFIPNDKYKYTCPQLRINYLLDTIIKNTDSLLKNNTAAIKKYWQPRTEDLVINTNNAPTVAAINTEDTLVAGATAPIKKELFKQMMKNFEQRKNILQQEIEIENDSIRVSFYDNGDIDGDSIAVFMNKVPVLTHQLLSAKSLNMYLAFSDTKPTTDISMYAENLGTIPPNTALMIITDGEKKHTVYMSSSLTQNSTIRLKRKKKPVNSYYK
jgi:hypothetical protein